MMMWNISRRSSQQVFSFKAGDVILKWYSSTHTVQTHESGYAILWEKLGNFFASKENLLSLQPNYNTQQCLLAASNESIAVDCSLNSSQNLQSISQALLSPSTCEGCSVVKSNLQKVEQQFNEPQHLVHSKVNVQIINSSSLSQSRTHTSRK